ncbi:MAG: polysaccharide biosynthesis/export family protein [Bacteroidota bacterium]
MLRYLLIFIVASTLLSSCVSYDKLVYLQSEKLNTQSFEVIPHLHRLEYGDMILVDFIDKIPKLQGFQTDKEISNEQGIGFRTNEPLVQGYTVSDSGMVELPLLESPVKVKGLTLEEAQFKIQREVLKAYDNVMVRVTLLNFYVTVLGEVERPARYPIYDRQISLFEVLSMAGEPTISANRKKVRLMRREGEKVKTKVLDLTAEEFMSSEYFYLHSGDVIYIEPLPGVKSIKSNRESISLVSTAINSLALIANIIFTFSRIN